MDTLTSKEFFDQLKAGSLKASYILTGIAKKSELDSEIFFAKNGDWNHWIKIPAILIEGVKVIKTFLKEGMAYTVVKLHLKAPATAEGKLFFDLLMMQEKEEEFGRCHDKWEKGHCGCGCCGKMGGCDAHAEMMHAQHEHLWGCKHGFGNPSK